jgi:hypothetical protein
VQGEATPPPPAQAWLTPQCRPASQPPLTPHSYSISTSRTQAQSPTWTYLCKTRGRRNNSRFPLFRKRPAPAKHLLCEPKFHRPLPGPHPLHMTQHPRIGRCSRKPCPEAGTKMTEKAKDNRGGGWISRTLELRVWTQVAVLPPWAVWPKSS